RPHRAPGNRPVPSPVGGPLPMLFSVPTSRQETNGVPTVTCDHGCCQLTGTNDLQGTTIFTPRCWCGFGVSVSPRASGERAAGALNARRWRAAIIDVLV